MLLFYAAMRDAQKFERDFQRAICHAQRASALQKENAIKIRRYELLSLRCRRRRCRAKNTPDAYAPLMPGAKRDVC